MLRTLMGLELSCSGGSFSGKNAALMFALSELQSDCSTSVCRSKPLSASGFEVSWSGGNFSGERTSRTFCVSERQSDPSRPVRGSIRPSSSIGLEVNCNGGSFSGLSADRILPSNELQTDSFSSTGGKKFKLALMSSFPAWCGGTVVCSAISRFMSSRSNRQHAGERPACRHTHICRHVPSTNPVSYTHLTLP